MCLIVIIYYVIMIRPNKGSNLKKTLKWVGEGAEQPIVVIWCLWHYIQRSHQCYSRNVVLPKAHLCSKINLNKHYLFYPVRTKQFFNLIILTDIWTLHLNKKITKSAIWSASFTNMEMVLPAMPPLPPFPVVT